MGKNTNRAPLYKKSMLTNWMLKKSNVSWHFLTNIIFFNIIFIYSNIKVMLHSYLISMSVLTMKLKKRPLNHCQAIRSLWKMMVQIPYPLRINCYAKVTFNRETPLVKNRLIVTVISPVNSFITTACAFHSENHSQLYFTNQAIVYSTPLIVFTMFQ